MATDTLHLQPQSRRVDLSTQKGVKGTCMEDADRALN